MSKQLFIDLGKAFCQHIGLEQPEKLLDGHAVEIDGVDFYLSHDEARDPGYAIVYCNFGAPPPERLAEAYHALLVANRLMYGSSAPAFMVTPGADVALAFHYRLGEITAEQLVELCLTLAAQAKEWRAHHFLEERLAVPGRRAVGAAPRSFETLPQARS